MKDAILLIAGVLIGIALAVVVELMLPAEPQIVRAPASKTIYVEVPGAAAQCPAQKPRKPKIEYRHRSLESLALACAEGRLTHDGRVGILVETGK